MATDGKGVDAVIVSGGGPDILVDAFNMARAGSSISNNNYFGPGMFDRDYIPITRVGWGIGTAGKQLVTGLCPGGRVRMERPSEVVMHGRMDPSLMAAHVFTGFDRLDEALLLMKKKAGDLIKPVVLVGQ